MEIININQVNIDKEHICCSLSDKKGENGVSCKKAWMKDRFAEGLVFKKLDVRGKVLIEYIPAENAWCPIEASGYMFINCFWVSGQFKGKGYGNKLLQECIDDAKAKGRKGLVVLSSKKKRPFLSDPTYLKYKGFLVCDVAQPYYELLYLPFENGTSKPIFKECCKNGQINEKDFVLYYSNQCPFTEKYAFQMAEFAEVNGVRFTLLKYDTKEQAQNAPSPFTIYSLFYDGKFVTNEILSETKFAKLLSEKLPS